MATTGYFIKHPLSNQEYVFDFTDDIPENDTLDEYTLTVQDSDGTDLTTDVLSLASINPTNITAIFTGGLDGQNYLITVRIVLGLSTINPTQLVEMRVRSAEV